MGGCCCCCSSKEPILNPAPPFYYYPRASEEQVPLSSHHGAPATTLSTGLLVDTNLNMSVPTVYRPPPAPVPFDVALARPQTPQRVQEASRDKTDGAAQTINSGSDQQIAAANTREISAKCDDAKDSDCNTQINLEVDTTKDQEIELSKSVEHLVFSTEEEDVCPTCLEEYDVENPKITTKCEHHFHLACVLEWMERSDTCPVCDKDMIIDPPID